MFVLIRVFTDAAAFDVLQIQHIAAFVHVNAGVINNAGGGIAKGNDLAAQLIDFFHGKLCYVSGAADGHGLAFEIQPARCQHFRGEVGGAVARCFRTDQASAVVQTLAGEHSRVFVADFFIVAVHVADFPRAHADVAGRNVHIRADMAVQLAHEGLAEFHDFRVGFALRVEVRAALGAAHGQRGERIFEDLLKSQEFDNAQIYGRMEADAALERADGVVELDAEAAVHLHISLVVHPGHAEDHGSFRFDNPFVNVGLYEFRVLFDGRLQRFHDFFDRLMKFRLVRIGLFDFGDNIFND